MKGLNPDTGREFDDTKHYVESSPKLTAADRAKIFEGNARKVFPRIDKVLAASQPDRPAPGPFRFSYAATRYRHEAFRPRPLPRPRRRAAAAARAGSRPIRDLRLAADHRPRRLPRLRDRARASPPSKATSIRPAGFAAGRSSSSSRTINPTRRSRFRSSARSSPRSPRSSSAASWSRCATPEPAHQGRRPGVLLLLVGCPPGARQLDLLIQLLDRRHGRDEHPLLA